MNWKQEWKPLVIMTIVFLCCYYLPVEYITLPNILYQSFSLVKWYTREHVLSCLIPAFFIAGALSVFLSKESVMRYLGAGANKVLAYGVASVSGTILAVCSCTILPLFAGIYRMGAGLGPATAFLYSGPAINVLAIILTARILGFELGIARAVFSILFSIIIGLIMHALFRKEEHHRGNLSLSVSDSHHSRPLWQNTLFFVSLVGILVFANWGKPDITAGLWWIIFTQKWIVTGLFAVMLGVILIIWFGLSRWKMVIIGIITGVVALIIPQKPIVSLMCGIIGLSLVTSTAGGEMEEWFFSSWSFAKQILPLMLAGVLVAGILLGQQGRGGLIPQEWVSKSVGGNSFFANFFAAVAGAFMYFATLTEVPIIQGLIGNGMGKGPALALLLAGPALSLPSMLVLRSIMGTKKTAIYVSLVIIMSTIIGILFGIVI